MQTILLLGASGYVGQGLLVELAQKKEYRIKVLTRQRPETLRTLVSQCNIEIVQGDLQKPKTLTDFFEPDSFVINLAYLWHAGETGNMKAMDNLLQACKKAKVRRLIHCSTAVVVGNVYGGLVTEDTECYPTNEYESTKLKIETKILSLRGEGPDVVILRPTSVFGPNAEPIRKLADDLIGGSRFLNYLKSCFLGKRRMNLVCIANVIGAIKFMINHQNNFNGQLFIVSDDAALINSFSEIEKILINQLHGKKHFFRPIPIPFFMLNLILRLFRKSKIKPNCYYSQRKLEQIGFNSPVNFSAGLQEYIDWYRATHVVLKQMDN